MSSDLTRIAEALERIAAALEPAAGTVRTTPPEPAHAERPEPAVQPPTWISTRAAARTVRTRNETLYDLVDDGIRVGVAKETGSAWGKRRHVRWRADLLPGWWSSLPNQAGGKLKSGTSASI